jgi:hypothetical protein
MNTKKLKILPEKIRGSHVGVIISFVIFIGFITFLYIIIQGPLFNNISQDYEQISKRLETNLLNSFSEETTLFSVKISSSTSENCVNFENLITNTGIGSNVIVKNSAQVNQGAFISEGDLKINRFSQNDKFFKIIFSKEFSSVENFEQDCEILSENDYNIGLFRKENYAFTEKIVNLLYYYENDYESLKNELALPLGTEFDFTFTYADKTKIGQVKNVSTNIYSKESSLQYIGNQEEILLGTLNLRVWG